MIKIFSGAQREKNPDLFQRYFALRYEMFIRRRQWALPARLVGLEIDEYDTDEAVYIFDLGSDGKIAGSVRLTPSQTGSLLADSFANLVESDAPLRAPDIYEGMRYVVHPSLSADQAQQTHIRLLSAMVEWCIEHGISWIQAFTDVEFFQTFVDITIETTPMGLPHPYAGGRKAPGGGECIAFRWPANRRVLQDLAAYARGDRQRASELVH